MKKIIVLSLLVGMFFAVGIARTRSTNWTTGNYGVTASYTLTAPYRNSCLYVQLQGNPITLNIRGGNYPIAVDDRYIDLWPLNFRLGETVTVVASQNATANIQWFWMENNE